MLLILGLSYGIGVEVGVEMLAHRNTIHIQPLTSDSLPQTNPPEGIALSRCIPQTHLVTSHLLQRGRDGQDILLVDITDKRVRHDYRNVASYSISVI